MHVQFTTALVLVALVSAVLLMLNRGDKLFPVIAVVAAGIEALMVFGIITLSAGKFRIDVILPALLVLAGGMCWARSSNKADTTAATALLAAAVIQLGVALGLLR